jgi:hypothetical protein
MMVLPEMLVWCRGRGSLACCCTFAIHPIISFLALLLVYDLQPGTYVVLEAAYSSRLLLLQCTRRLQVLNELAAGEFGMWHHCKLAGSPLPNMMS